jgi:hypothetical protein
MKKEFIRRSYDEVHSPSTEYIRRIASGQWEHFEVRRKIIYDWLNKTDAPQEVWIACEPRRETKL